MRIAANDTALAHAVASTALRATGTRDARFVQERLTTLRSVPRINEALARHFGARLIYTGIIRAKGSRANALWVVLDCAPVDDQVCANVCVCRYHHQCLDFIELPIRISAHAYARVLQRSVGAADHSQVPPLLAPHVSIAVMRTRNQEPPVGDALHTYSADGTMVWERRPPGDRLVAATWISADAAVEPYAVAGIEAARKLRKSFSRIEHGLGKTDQGRGAVNSGGGV